MAAAETHSIRALLLAFALVSIPVLLGCVAGGVWRRWRAAEHPSALWYVDLLGEVAGVGTFEAPIADPPAVALHARAVRILSLTGSSAPNAPPAGGS